MAGIKDAVKAIRNKHKNASGHTIDAPELPKVNFLLQEIEEIHKSPSNN